MMITVLFAHVWAATGSPAGADLRYNHMMIHPNIDLELMRQVKHFRSLPLDDLAAIVAAGLVRRFEKGETIFNEGDECAGMHVLLQGRVDLCRIGPEGQLSILNTLKPVVMFNEVAVLDGGPNPVTAQAVEDALIWSVQYREFQQLLARYPQIALGLLEVLARRNRLMIMLYGDLSFRSVPARLAKHLLELSADGMKTIPRIQHPIRVIAARVVTTPEVVSRTFKVLGTRGLIAVDRSSIRVLDVASLQDLAQIVE